MTALTVYPTSAASTTMPQLGSLATSSGGSLGSGQTTVIGQSTGYGPVSAMGTTSAWPALVAIDYSNSSGWVLDANTLDNTQVQAGAWSVSAQLAVSSGTIVTDVYFRVMKISAVSGSVVLPGSFVTFGDPIKVSAVSLNTTPATVSGSGSFLSMKMYPGDRLYVSLWLNVTTNSTGNSNATVAVYQPSGATGNVATEFTTPGYTSLTLDQESVAYKYGNFCFNDGVNYLLLQKNFDIVEIVPQQFKIARFEGMKKTGEAVNSKQVQIVLRVTGSSRNDLEQKIDALYQALDRRQQNLTLHSIDGRYWVADAIKASCPLPPGRVLSTTASITFACQQPYAVSPLSSSYTSGSVVTTLDTTGVYKTGTLHVSGGGTALSRPTIKVTNNSAVAITQVTIYQNTSGYSLQVPNITLNNGDYLTCVCDPNITNGYTSIINSGSPINYNGIYPFMTPGDTQWLVKVNAASAPTITVQFTWYPRYLS